MPNRLFRSCVIAALAACSSGPTSSWQIVAQDLPGGVLSVWGTTGSDVYIAGAGARIDHFDGTAWTKLDPGLPAAPTLWWVFGIGGTVYFAGDAGTILAYDGTTFTPMSTPDTTVTVFGIWGASPDDLWAVGGRVNGNGAFAWRLQGSAWTAVANFPVDPTTDAIWKMAGRASDDAWLVGTNGVTVQWDGSAFAETMTHTGSLFTVSADTAGYVAVGGGGTGIIFENDGSGWTDESPNGAQLFAGVDLSPNGDYVVGYEGGIYKRDGASWNAVDTGLSTSEDFHSVWVDPSGGVWTVGGQLLTDPPTEGILVHEGTTLPGNIP